MQTPAAKAPPPPAPRWSSNPRNWLEATQPNLSRLEIDHLADEIELLLVRAEAQAWRGQTETWRTRALQARVRARADRQKMKAFTLWGTLTLVQPPSIA